MSKLAAVWANRDKIAVIWRMFWNIVGSLQMQGRTQDQAIRMVYNLVAKRHEMTTDEKADAEREWQNHASGAPGDGNAGVG